MAEVEKYLFEVSFDDEGVEAATVAALQEEVVPAEELPPPPPPPPTFSEAELAMATETARAEGLAEGIERGRADASAEFQANQLQALNVAGEQLTMLLATQYQQNEEQQRMLLDITLAITRKLFPYCALRFGLAEIEAMFQEILGSVLQEPRLVVRCAESELEPLTVNLEQAARLRGYQGKLVFLSDTQLAAGDCRVEWAEGGLDFRRETIWNDIDRLVAEVVKRS